MDSLSNVIVGLSWSSLLLLLLCCHIVTFIVTCTYRLTYHPFARYPGPFFARITDWYGAWHAYKGDLHLCMYDSHQKYGDVVRLGPNRILFNTCEGLHDIYTSKQVKKAKGYLTIIPTKGAYSVHTAIDKTMHRHKRMVISQGLGYDVLRKFEPTMMNHILKFCDLLLAGEQPETEGWTAPKNMTDFCDHLTFDIMGTFGFGRDFQMQDREDNRFLIKAIAASNIRTSIYGQFPELAKFKLEKILYPKGYILRQKFLSLTREFAEERLRAGKDAHADLFSFVVDAKDPETGVGFSQEELWSESKFLIVAGSDTSSTVLASTFFYLSRNSRCYDKVTNEVRSAFSDPSSIHSSDALTSCIYLRACIYESMRMSPPAGGSLWRESEGATICDNYVPAGYDVGTSIYAIHHNKRYFHRPFDYIPERWIVESASWSSEFSFVSPDSVAQGHKVLNPFSLGPRGCIGRAMAYMEMLDTMANVIFRMDFRKASGKLGRVGEGGPGLGKGRERVDEFQLEDHLTSTKDGPFIEFRRIYV